MSLNSQFIDGFWVYNFYKVLPEFSLFPCHKEMLHSVQLTKVVICGGTNIPHHFFRRHMYLLFIHLTTELCSTAISECGEGTKSIWSLKLLQKAEILLVIRHTDTFSEMFMHDNYIWTNSKLDSHLLQEWIVNYSTILILWSRTGKKDLFSLDYGLKTKSRDILLG